MKIDFEKYHGTGNDFVLIDNRQGHFPKGEIKLIRSICRRHFGVGSDGLMLIEETDEADFEMIFYNPDGSKSLCGNGSRCAIHFAVKLGLASEKGTMLTTDGIHDYRFINDLEVAVSMRNPSPISNREGYPFIHTGSPHLVVMVDDVDKVNVVEAGRLLRYSKHFEADGGTNVNFVSPLSEENFAVRTYERGVEDETLSCGTGVAAVALVLAQSGKAYDKAFIQTRGGLLSVMFKFHLDQFSDIWLQGPVQSVFTGSYNA